jgi:hypothetical protein
MASEGHMLMKSDGNSNRRGIRETTDSEDFLLEFDTSSEDFMRGFECGEIWACLTDGVEYLHSLISADNALMIMRMTEAVNRHFDYGYVFDACELTPHAVDILELGPGDWMSVTIKRAVSDES